MSVPSAGARRDDEIVVIATSSDPRMVSGDTYAAPDILRRGPLR